MSSLPITHVENNDPLDIRAAAKARRRAMRSHARWLAEDNEIIRHTGWIRCGGGWMRPQKSLAS